MATLAQLEAEPEWGREIATSAMVGLGLQLRAAYGAGAGAVGIKGNAAHLNGGHRSQEWIKGSAYCTDRSYATQSGLTGDQLRYNAALDFTPGVWGSADNRHKMTILTSRMITAMKAGRCDEVLEVFGTVNGTTVTGWRNDLNHAATADSSHLDHIHIRWNRRYCNDNAVMAKVAEILLEDEMLTTEDVTLLLTTGVFKSDGSGYGTQQSLGSTWLSTWNLARQMAATLAAIAAKVDIDPVELAAIEQAAAEGARQAVLGSVDQLAAAIVSKLPANSVTPAEIEAALREVFADAGAQG